MEALRETLSLLTPQFFDRLIVIVIVAGLVLAARRLRADLRRRTRPDEETRPLGK